MHNIFLLEHIWLGEERHMRSSLYGLNLLKCLKLVVPSIISEGEVFSHMCRPGQDDITYLNPEAADHPFWHPKSLRGSWVYQSTPTTPTACINSTTLRRLQQTRRQESRRQLQRKEPNPNPFWCLGVGPALWRVVIELRVKRSMPAFQLASRILPLGWHKCGLHMQIPANIWKRVGTSNCITEPTA